MSNSTKIMFPVLNGDGKEIFFRGYVNQSEQLKTTIFITNLTTNLKEFMKNKKNGDSVIYGHCNRSQNTKNKSLKTFSNYLVLNENLQVNKLYLDGKSIDSLENFIVITYDRDRVLNSEMISDSFEDFVKLQSYLQNDCGYIQEDIEYKPLLKCSYWLDNSMLFQHILNYVNLLNWFVTSVRGNRKVSIKHGNLILAIVTDLVLGYFVLELLSWDTKELSFGLMTLLEKLVNSLYSLLKWLMGAPAGLKLNNAFNKMLGKYFSYHIHLWWLFLDVSGEKLDTILHVYRYLGYLGFTFQAAFISDMICIATFHAYCIYVYVARLFNIQVSGLTALLRLFVGRKYNPLRRAVDSCEYNNQELFVGTVAIAVLLLLLPTTAMYYIVFTAFRLLSLSLQYVLAKLIYCVQTLPIYVFVLWLTNSSKVADNIFIETVENQSNTLVIKVKLMKESICNLIEKFRPPVEVPKRVEWTNLISNMLSGKQIV